MENVHSTFARELRRHCLKRGSIAVVCRGTGINRQQFNKYLAGRMLPGSLNMRKICSFLAVSEADLMGGPRAQAPRSMTTNDYLPNFVANDFALPWSSGGASFGPGMASVLNIPTGFYDFYLPHPGACHMLLRWLLRISDGARGQVFSCRTSALDGGDHRRRTGRAKFHGRVVPGVHDVLLIADVPQQPSVIAVGRVPFGGRSRFPAQAVTRTGDCRSTARAALCHLGTVLDVREALARTGAISIFDPRLDEAVAMRMGSAADRCSYPAQPGADLGEPAAGDDAGFDTLVTPAALPEFG